jgi:3,4-dihydroxy 2-butanone 4-phosphate synthase / GTP cyclohydrolase II
MALATIAEAIDEIRAGRFVIVVDDATRENEGDLVIAAEYVTPEAINFMATHGRGLICVAMTGERLDELQIPLMVANNTSPYGTAFCVSIEAKGLTSTGISAADRAATIRAVIAPDATPEHFARPGHTFPLRARDGGVLERPGQTEASVDLARLAGLYPAAAICEIMNEDGTMARLPDLEVFATRHGLKILSVAQLIDWRRQGNLIARQAETILPTRHGVFRAIAFTSSTDGAEHLALVRGDIANGEPPLVRIHSECLTGDVFGSGRCDCGEQLDRAMREVAMSEHGVILYLRQEGRGIGLVNKIRAYALQDTGMDTVEANEHLGFEADSRDYAIAAQILLDLGVSRVRLLTNNPRKVADLGKYGVTVDEIRSLAISPSASNWRYLQTKRVKLGHILDPMIDTTTTSMEAISAKNT